VGHAVAGRARGIAVAESFASFVAQVAEVSLETEVPRVHRVVVNALAALTGQRIRKLPFVPAA